MYKEAVESQICDELHVTRVYMDLKPADYDRVFPEIKEEAYELVDHSDMMVSKTDNNAQYRFEVYKKRLQNRS